MALWCIVKATEHKNAGNVLFKAEDYEGAIKEFDEGLNNNPRDMGLLSNRCFAYIKTD